jgi:hypothetical protein
MQNVALVGLRAAIEKHVRVAMHNSMWLWKGLTVSTQHPHPVGLFAVVQLAMSSTKSPLAHGAVGPWLMMASQHTGTALGPTTA